MGNAKLPTGIREAGSGIQIRFTWEGQRYEPIWPKAPTKTNIQAASRLRSEIVSQAKLGLLTWDKLAEYFPQYTVQETVDSSTPLFCKIAQNYLDIADVSKNTRNEYRKVLNLYWMPLYASRPIDSITSVELRVDISAIDWTSNKTRNNALIPLRGVFDLAYDADLIPRNPTDKIKNLKHQKKPPDPFSIEEMTAILSYLSDQYTGKEGIYRYYFEIAFWTGMRTSELLALTWHDVDFRNKTIRVDKAVSKGVQNDETKTFVVRDVILNEQAMQAVKSLKAYTFLQGGNLFISPRSGEPWITDKPPRDIFTAALKKLGIRHRKAYNTRHTYATICLMEGVNPAFAASQLGHSLQMFLNTYAKWINGDKDRSEIDKISKIGKFSGNSKEVKK